MPSSRFIAAIAAQETADQAVMLMTITHADFGSLRWCTGGADTVSRSNTFAARGLELAPPGEGSEARSGARITIDNVDQDAVAQLRSVTTGRPSVLLEAILAATPDVVEMNWVGLQLTAARPSAGGIECDIVPRDDGEEQWPLQSYSPGRTPGLF